MHQINSSFRGAVAADFVVVNGQIGQDKQALLPFPLSIDFCHFDGQNELFSICRGGSG